MPGLTDTLAPFMGGRKRKIHQGRNPLYHTTPGGTIPGSEAEAGVSLDDMVRKSQSGASPGAIMQGLMRMAGLKGGL